MVDDRIEAFIQDVMGLEGHTPANIGEATRQHLAVYENMFRDEEVDDRKKDAAATRCRDLCCARVEEEINRNQNAEHLHTVLTVIASSARFPLK